MAATSNGFRVAVRAPRGPRMYLGPRALLWNGASVWTAEPSPFEAFEFSTTSTALEAAQETLTYFEWGTSAARDRIVEIIDAAGFVIHKAGFGASGTSALRVM